MELCPSPGLAAARVTRERIQSADAGKVAHVTLSRLPELVAVPRRLARGRYELRAGAYGAAAQRDPLRRWARLDRNPEQRFNSRVSGDLANRQSCRQARVGHWFGSANRKFEAVQSESHLENRPLRLPSADVEN